MIVRSHTITNWGHPGAIWSTIDADAVNEADVKYTPIHAGNITIGFGGSNNLAAGQNGPTAYAEFEATMGARTRAGSQTNIVGTIWPISSLTGSYEVARQDYNTRVRAMVAAGLAAKCVDFELDSRLANSANSQYFVAGGPHLTDDGYEVVGELMAAAVNGLP